MSVLEENPVLARDGCDDDEHEDAVKIHGFDRIILGCVDLVVPNGGPLPVVNLATIVDPFNIRMLALGPYDQAYVNNMRQNSLTFLKDTYGLDFAAGFHDPATDLYILPNAVLYQLCRSPDPTARLNFDSYYPERTGKWSAYEVGVLCAMTTSGVYTSGARAGINYFAGDLISVAEYNFINPDKDWQNKAKYRETIYGKAIWPSRQSLNSFLARDTPASVQITDSHGNTGFLIDSTFRTKLLDGNWTLMARAVFSFQNIAC